MRVLVRSQSVVPGLSFSVRIRLLFLRGSGIMRSPLTLCRTLHGTPLSNDPNLEPRLPPRKRLPRRARRRWRTVDVNARPEDLKAVEPVKAAAGEIIEHRLVLGGQVGIDPALQTGALEDRHRPAQVCR